MSKHRNASEHDRQMADYLRLWNNPTEKNVTRYAKNWMRDRVRGGVKVTDFKPEAMLAGVHKARVKGHPDPAEVAKSIKWLTDNGYRTTIGPGDES